MLLSLSVRIAEEFSSKEKASMSLEALADLAVAAGYDGICMRASQVGVHSPATTIDESAKILQARRLCVTMVTGDFHIVYNNDRGPDCLRNIEPYLELARKLNAPLVRVALKQEHEIPWAREAAQQASKCGIKLVHQCHTQSLFETVDGIERTLRQIDSPHFGLIYEPANLELCGQEYGPKTIERLAPWICNVYLQNQLLTPHGKLTLNPWSRGPVSFDLIPIHAEGGIDFRRVFDGLAAIDYRGPVTVHQASSPGELPSVSASATAKFLRALTKLA